MKTKTRTNPQTCTESHEGKIPTERIAALPESQAGPGRHRCAACAYQLGIKDAIRSLVKGRSDRAAVLREVRNSLDSSH